MDEQGLFERLLRAETEIDVEAILKKSGYSLDNLEVWQPLGGMENNFSTVGNQQTEATAALVEKIINGIDANLMAECFSKRIDPESSEAPATMQIAIQEFFRVRDGFLANLDPASRTKLAANLHLVAVGEKTAPCYLIID